MSKNKKTGNLGEQMATDFLINKGYEILERNWRFSRAEIDIIARKAQILVFIEVKTRTSNAFGQPEEFLNQKQEKLITDAAAVYMERKGHEWEFRFDIIAITLDQAEQQIQHFEDAFFPGW